MPATRPTTFEVIQSEPYRGRPWRVTGYQDGKRKLFWFNTEKEAKAHAAYLNRERAAYGSKLTLTPEMRLEATLAAELLAPHGKSILDATRFYVAHLERASPSVPFSKLAALVRAEFARRLEKNETCDRNVETLHDTLRKLEIRFGDTEVSAITTSEIRDWLTGLPLAAKTRNRHRGYTRQVFGFAVEWGYAPTNPVVLKKFRERYNEGDVTGSLSADETEKLLRAADPEVIPYLALWFFTGVRRATLEKLDWSEINLTEKRAIVPRGIGKNQRRYRVTLSDNLLEWLRPHAQSSGSLLARSRAPQSRGEPSPTRTRKLLVQAARTAGVTLADNSGRNSFISHHVAFYENVGKTSLEGNTSAAMIQRDYLDLVSTADAERFWQIRPTA